MIDILYKGTDERQGLINAQGTIGKLKWFASFFGKVWCVTIPAGCEGNTGPATIATVRERLTEAYPEG